MTSLCVSKGGVNRDRKANAATTPRSETTGNQSYGVNRAAPIRERIREGHGSTKMHEASSAKAGTAGRVYLVFSPVGTAATCGTEFPVGHGALSPVSSDACVNTTSSSSASSWKRCSRNTSRQFTSVRRDNRSYCPAETMK